jgi:hypothetical protein
MLQNYADLLRRIEVPQAGANWSNTATFMARAVNGVSGKLGTVIGAILGRSAIPVPFLGEAVGAGAANVVGKGAQAIQARAVARQMPLVAEQMQQWQRAMLAAQRANTPPSRAAATAATLNLSRTLAPLGLNFQQIASQTPGSAYGGPNQQDVPGPVQKKDGGRIEGQQRATRGKVEGDSRHKGPVESKSDDKSSPVKIDATHDGPWMSCMSIDGKTMYRNKNIPETANIKGKTVDVNDMLLHHEVPERDDLEKLIDQFKERFHREPNKNERKAIYLKAHNRSGTPNERAYAKKIGVDWKAWSAWCRGEEAKIEKMKFTNQPKDADVKPIPHSHGDLEAEDKAA